ncbi:protein of unknown function [Paraburkholderia dioscoreae]|uniref:Uncharacterized protein n=1 Tax=Paraburkholderia dioscoreae TaxID=2604047 RepID=A0A5Q4ZR36_9BURK|nr:protein of unknown function [Paraburkholderia dioscoreae]
MPEVSGSVLKQLLDSELVVTTETLDKHWCYYGKQ